MTKRFLRIATLAFILSCGFVLDAFSQAAVRYQIKNDFEVIAIENGHMLAREGCSGFKLVSVFVVDTGKLSEARISSIIKQVSGSFPEDYDLILQLVTERRFAGPAAEEFESEYHRSLRGLYVRAASKERLFVFLSGTSSDELGRAIR